MKQKHTSIQIETRRSGLTEVTRRIAAWVKEQGIEQGLLSIFIKHTSASLVIQENADPDVLTELENFFRQLVREDNSLYRHTAEGPDDMPAHIKSALTQTHLSIPIQDGRLGLGTWQGIYLFEHRSRPHSRTLLLHLLGE
mgnify:CR=1 FL=1